jgi:hypothetical protein
MTKKKNVNDKDSSTNFQGPQTLATNVPCNTCEQCDGAIADLQCRPMFSKMWHMLSCALMAKCTMQQPGT